MIDTLLYNATVLTLNRDFEIHRPGMVGISGDRIAMVAPDADGTQLPQARSSIDVKGGIVMPGLVNAHTHLPMALFRGLADDLSLESWLNDHIFPAEFQHIRPETVRPATRLAAAELLLSGTTTCCDGYFHEDAVADAVYGTGLRAVLGQGVVDFPAPGVSDPARNVEAARQFVEKWESIDPMVTPAVFCHAPYTCSKKTLTAAKALTRDRGVLFQIHVSETRTEVETCRREHGASPIGYLDRLGILDAHTLLVHGVWLDERDIDCIANQGCPVVHCPESNMKLASGIAPVTRLLDAGVTVALGTDGAASNNDLDLFREMDTAAKLQKIATGDPTAAAARSVLRMATIEGAAAVGLGAEVGSLEPGKAADLMVLDPDCPALVPDFHPESLAVYAAGGGAVKDVMTAGRFRVRDGRLVALETASIIDAARQAAAAVAPVRRSG